MGPNSAMIRIEIGSQLVQIAGSSVLLTGATGGIGHAIARALRARGAELILTGRRTDVLEPLADELDARALAADLSDRTELERLLDDAGDVDILLANAAIPAAGRLESFSIAEVDRTLEVNLRAPVALARALLPAMLERRARHLLFMSSIAGKAPVPGASIYHATKSGLRGFAAALRADLHGSGVGVSASSLASSATPASSPTPGVMLPPGVGTRTPEDVARAVVERDRAQPRRGRRRAAAQRGGAMFAGLAPELAANVVATSGLE